MFLDLALLASVAVTPAFSGEFVGYHFDQTTPNRWERFDLVLTNDTDQPSEIKACPDQAQMIMRDHQRSKIGAFAVKFDDGNWSYSCETRSVEAGQSVTLKLFFRARYEPGPQRDITVQTSGGDFVIKGGKQRVALNR
ncbi:VCBS domain-containing protein [Erythrobacter crassostreae]|uniref:VCBS domain-containing protein n=1 Tax=Erythrobacter crassostreae TaxID=2828328 RepID=A0A9X1JNV1_9SPHN|nr:VCBS domain-containing protein [Erythrobacter crassostrea]MBV7260078.1 VCBS domain-containing protein [Erythrobacter crassostrea]